jgi:hypothetical protein
MVSPESRDARHRARRGADSFPLIGKQFRNELCIAATEHTDEPTANPIILFNYEHKMKLWNFP